MRKLLLFPILACGCGCRAIAPVAKAPTAESIEQMLVGTWTTTTPEWETQTTYSKDGHYEMKWGRRGFKTGFYEEKGGWEIYLGDEVSLNPEHREVHVVPTDKKFIKSVKAYCNSMDEGAWKPLPGKVEFRGRDLFNETWLDPKKPEVYRRVRFP